VKALVALILVLGCGASRVPANLRGYDILVAGTDEQSVELARAMKSAGYHVKTKVKGGKHTAALIHFTFSDPGPDQAVWLHLRLADTRSGIIIAAGMIPLDSTVPTPRTRAVAAVQTLAPNP
jgi:hypothetical protein